MKKVTTSEGQSMFDLALQEYGDAAGVISIAEINGYAITQALETGTELSVDDTNPVNARVRNYFSDRAYKVNTGKVTPSSLPSGIHDDYHDQYHN